MPGHFEEQVCQAGVALVHHKITAAVLVPVVYILHNGDRPGPFLIGTGNAPVRFLIPDRGGENVKCPVIAELFHHLRHGRFAQPVVSVMLRNRGLNRLFAGDIGLVGGAVCLQLVMSLRISNRVLIDWPDPLGL